jgi:hypothetical protein
LADNRFIWGIIPDFWSISGSGLILGGAIWVAVAKSRIKQEHSDDLERNGYIALNGEEQGIKENDFDLEEFGDDEEEQAGSSLSPPHAPSRERHIGDTIREDQNLNIGRDGELAETTLWSEEQRN